MGNCNGNKEFNVLLEFWLEKIKIELSLLEEWSGKASPASQYERHFVLINKEVCSRMDVFKFGFKKRKKQTMFNVSFEKRVHPILSYIILSYRKYVVTMNGGEWEFSFFFFFFVISDFMTDSVLLCTFFFCSPRRLV